MSDEETRAERWVFGGSRVNRGKRAHEWIDGDGDGSELLFKARGAGYSVGSVYEVQVSRGGESVTMHGKPRYTGDRADELADELVDELAAKHRAAEVELDLLARERRDGRDDPVEQAIRRLVELAERVPASQRTGFAAYVLTRLIRGAWSK